MKTTQLHHCKRDFFAYYDLFIFKVKCPIQGCFLIFLKKKCVVKISLEELSIRRCWRVKLRNTFGMNLGLITLLRIIFIQKPKNIFHGITPQVYTSGWFKHDKAFKPNEAHLEIKSQALGQLWCLQADTRVSLGWVQMKIKLD